MDGNYGIQMAEVRTHDQRDGTASKTQSALNEVGESKKVTKSGSETYDLDAKDTVSSVVTGAAANGSDEVEQSYRDGKEGTISIRDEHLVTWQDELTDPGNPKNWAMGRRVKALLAMSSFVFMSQFTVSIVAPTLPAIAAELQIEQTAIQQMVLSAFLLGFACGPLIASPMSEVYGRAVIILRFISGLFGSATLGIGGGTLSDTFRSKERGKGVAIYSWCSVFSPLFSVILGGFIAKYTTWRWAFFSPSILSALFQFLGLFLLEETYPPLLLRRIKWKLIKETGDTRYYTEFDHLENFDARILSQNLIWPFKLLATQPIIQVLALYNGFLYGNTYIFYADFVDLWTNRYHESVQIAGLNYASIAIASTIATAIYAVAIDRIYRTMSRKNGGKGKPEFRIPLMAPATFLLGAGMFWYGWSAQAVLHWIMPNIGCSLFIAGAVVCTSSVNAYLVDTYGQYSASAIAAISILRCLTGFSFPLFAPYMYRRLGYGWAATLLGLIALGIGFPIIGLLWKFGVKLRHMSPYCAVNKR